MRARTVCDIIINRHRERIWLLKDHSHTLSEQVDIHVSINVLVVQQHLSRDAAALYQIVHPVQRLEQRRFSAAGWADKRGNLSFRQNDVDIFQRLKRAVIKIEIFNYEFVQGCQPPFAVILREINVERALIATTRTSRITAVA